MTSVVARPAQVLVLPILKQATREEHAAIERCVTLMDPGITSAAYRAYLAAMLGYLTPTEHALRRVPQLREALPDLGLRWKSGLLRRDLALYGTPLVSVCAACPELGSVARALGCLYVLEGSTLGGQILSRHVRHEIGVVSLYLDSYGRRVGAMWATFGAAVEAYARTSGGIDDMVDAARETFATLRAWLEERR